MFICSKCVVGEHKGHKISDKTHENQFKIDPLIKKKNILQKKIEASIRETKMFCEHITEIEEQLEQEQENTLQELDEKLDLMIEMLKNRKDTLHKQVTGHYKKQDLLLMEAKKNIERRKNNLEKIENKINNIVDSTQSNENKIERMSEEFLNINKTFDSPFHQFKHCNINLNPQIANQMFEQIGSLKYPVVQFSYKTTFEFFNQKYKPISKAYFFGDSNNQNLILQYDFASDVWSRKEVSCVEFSLIKVYVGSIQPVPAVLLRSHRSQRRQHPDYRRTELVLHKREWPGLHVQHRERGLHGEGFTEPEQIHPRSHLPRKLRVCHRRQVHQWSARQL